MYTQEQLLAKKQQIEEAKQKIAKLEGEEKSLLERLKEEFECNSIEEARAKLVTLEARQSKLNASIQEKSMEIEEQYFSNK